MTAIWANEEGKSREGGRVSAFEFADMIGRKTLVNGRVGNMTRAKLKASLRIKSPYRRNRKRTRMFATAKGSPHCLIYGLLIHDRRSRMAGRRPR